MQIILILVLIGLMHSARSFSPLPGLGSGAGGVTLAAGFLLLTALFAGNLFKQLHLPRLTGYLLTGVLVGPYGIDLVSEQMLTELRVFNGVAIALIALTAGTEMEFRSMRPLFRGILWITGVAVIGTVVLLAATAYVFSPLLPFLTGLSVQQVAAVAAVLGVSLAAQSPAVVVALRKEMEADGPLARTVLGVVVLSDLVIIVLFAVASSVARALLGGAAQDTMTGGMLAWEILGSAAAGMLIGILVATFLRSVPGGGPLFVVTVGFLVAEVGQRIHLDPLLVALFAGLWIRNLTAHGDRLHAEIEAASLPVYIAFFSVAGATIHLNALAAIALPAALFVLFRAAGFLTGSALAGRIAGSEPVVRKYAGFGLLPQAGLALALAILFARSFPQLGNEASTLVFGVVALNELISPILYRWALVRSGEAGTQAATAGVTPLLRGNDSAVPVR